MQVKAFELKRNSNQFKLAHIKREVVLRIGDNFTGIHGQEIIYPDFKKSSFKSQVG